MKRGEPFNVLRNHNSWSNVPRAEAVVLGLGGFANAAAATAALGTVGYNLAIVAASLALSVATNAIISALTPVPPTPKQSLLVNARDAAAPQEFVYGETRKGGITTYYETTRGGSVLYQIIAVAAHEVESIDAIYINDKEVTLSQDGYDNGDRQGAGWVLDDEWTSDGTEHEIRIFYHKGDQTTKFSTFANSGIESLDTVFFNTGKPAEDSQNFGGVGQPTRESFIGNGISYIFVRYAFNAGVFSKGLPLITCKLKGKKVYDPRTNTTAYSNNSALCIRDFLTNTYGLNDPEVDDTVFSVAANTCDENVALSGGGSEKRYTLNGVVNAGQAYGEVLQQMVTSCAGTLFWGAGKWKLTVGDYNAPTKVFTLDDLRSSISLQTRNNLRDQFNRVQGVFVNQDNRYIAEDYPPYPPSADYPTSLFLEQDNGVEQVRDLDLPFTTSSATAQRLAKMTLFRGREQMVFSAYFGLNAFDVEVGEIVALTIERYGWEDKEFEVVGWNFNSSSEGGDLRVSLTLRETSEAAFSWDAEEEEILNNDSNLTATLDPVTNLTAQYDGTVSTDGTFLNGIIVDWDAVVGSTGYEVEWMVNEFNYDAYGGVVEESSAITTRQILVYKAYVEILYRQPDLSGFTFYTTGGGSGLTEEQLRAQLAASPERASFTFSGVVVNNPTTAYPIRPVIDNTLYNIRVRAVNNNGVKSLWRAVTFDSNKDNTIPNAPTGLSATGGYGSIKIEWNPVTTNTDGSTASDVFLYAIYRGTSTNPTTLVATTAGTSWSDVGLLDNTRYYYRVKAVDFSGNESAYSSSFSALTNAGAVDGQDGADGDTSITGRVYYQILTASQPATPSASSYDTTTGLFSGLTANWAVTQPSVSITDTSLQEWSSQFTVTIDGTTGAQTINFTTPVGAIQVTSNIQSDNYIAGTSGWSIERDTGDAEFNAVTVRGSISVGNTSQGIFVNDPTVGPNAVYSYQNSTSIYGLFAKNSAFGGGAMEVQSNGGFTGTFLNSSFSAGAFGPFVAVNAQNTGSGGGHGQVGVSLAGGGYAFRAVDGGFYDVSGDGYNPFTGRHDGMILKSSSYSLGDIVVDTRVISRSLSDSFTELTPSQEANQRGAVGVVAKVFLEWYTPASFIDKEASRLAQESHTATPTNPMAAPVTIHDVEDYEGDYDLVTVNAVGEGAINVCGEGGDISKGDLIVTSSVPGKGMKQSDDIVRSYTVAKAREDVTFSDPAEVKMIACIYLCG